VCVMVIGLIGYSLTVGNLGNFKDFSLAVLGAMFPLLAWALDYGFKARLDRFFEKGEPKKPDLREHTETLCKQVYEPLLTIFVGQNPSIPPTREYKVHPLDEHGIPIHRLVHVEELPELDRGIDHLRSHKAYQGTYMAWEEALTLKRKYNDQHLELIQ
jgi:hypothetical protein